MLSILFFFNLTSFFFVNLYNSIYYVLLLLTAWVLFFFSFWPRHLLFREYALLITMLTQKSSRLKFAAFCLVLFVYYCVRDASLGTFTPATHITSKVSRVSAKCYDPSPTYTPPDKNHSRWREIPTRYPVKKFMQLPTQRKSRLAPVQHRFKRPSSREAKLQQKRRDAVKEVFLRGWSSYKKNAWGQDELKPISGQGTSKRVFGGWGATLVDSLDTLKIMELHDDYEEAVAAVVSINFDPSEKGPGTISVFETTIRYLGGLLSAYDLTDCKDKRLLDKAVELGDMIYASFDTENRMPVTRWDPSVAASGSEQYPALSGVLAEVASSTLEFTRLSQLTGDMRWFDAVQRITDLMDEQQDQTVLPGLWPKDCNVRDADFTQGSTFTLGAMADSAYEYLPKMYALLGGTEKAAQYGKLFNYAMDTAMKYLFFRPRVPGNADILISGEVHARSVSSFTHHPEGQHLVCYLGGALALGGRLLANQTHVEVGRKLTEGCIWTYRNTPSGIMPEIFKMAPCKSESDCLFDEKAWHTNYGSGTEGFSSVIDPRYLLRPEAIESVFYLYRITGDRKFQDAAWDMFQAIEEHTHTNLANAEFNNVFAKKDDKKSKVQDTMESFWLAETLKYFYLIFSDPELISLDEFVFNTEAHPFRIQ